MSCVGNCDAEDPSCHNRTRNTQACTLQVSIVKKKRKKKEGEIPRRASTPNVFLSPSPPTNGSGAQKRREWQINEPDASNLITRSSSALTGTEAGY